MPDLSLVETIQVSHESANIAIARSHQILTLRYLKRASKYSRLKRVFSFLNGSGTAIHQGADATLGFSFSPGIFFETRISSSEIRSLELQIKQSSQNTENFYRKAADSYNAAIELYKHYVSGKESNRDLFHSLLTEYATKGTMDTDRMIKAIYWAMRFEIGRNFTQHFFLIAKSQLNRLFLEGDRYNRIPSLIQIPSNQHLHFWYDRIKINENKLINYDVSKAILDIQNP